MKSVLKHARAMVAFALVMMVGVAFVPAGILQVHGATFDTAGAVSGLAVAKAGYNSVTLVWSPYAGATKYQVYKAKSQTGKFTRIKTTSGTSYKRRPLTTNTTCYYKVRAKAKVNGTWQYSQFSTVVPGTPVLATPAVSTISQGSSIAVTWPKVAGAKKYRIYRSTAANDGYTYMKTQSSRTFTNTKVKAGITYYYKVRAFRTVYGKKKYSAYSAPAAGCVTPSGITGVSAVSGSDGISLSWAAATGAANYEIQRKTGDTGTYSVVGTSATTSFKDTNVANGLTYYYKIRAYNTVNGSNVYGAFSATGHSRALVVSTAVAWLGCKESNASNKPIVALYNQNMGTSFSYKTAWCAMFVSAVAIKAGATDIIVRGSYCPTVRSTYVNSKTSKYKYASGSSYTPKAGDVIFFDWNKNGVPDHTGLVASVSGKTVKTIEGNYNDAVGYRTFSVGYSMVQGYGLPNYDEGYGIVYTGTSSSSVGCGELATEGIGTDPDGYESVGPEYDTVQAKVDKLSPYASDYNKMRYMVKKVRRNAKTEGIECTTSQYYAAFIYKLCQAEGLESSIVTSEDSSGNAQAWVEVVLGDKYYRVDASKSSGQMTEFTPESTDTEGTE